MFTLLAGFTMAETARDSLFLGAGGRSQLALAYLLLAALAVGAVALNARIVKHLGRRRALVATLLAAAAGTATFAALPQSIGVSFALYLWTGLVGTLVVVQFWLLAATRFTSVEAKRLFGPISACGALGTLAGALLASAVLALWPVRTLLVFAGGFYVVAAVLLGNDRESVESRLQSSARQPFASPHRAFATRPGDRGYVTRLALFVVCATASAMFADYLFKSAAATHYGTQELAHFIARFSAGVAVISLVLQVVGAAWLARRAGVLGMILILPALLLGTSLSTVLLGTFAAICATKGADGALRYSVNRVAGELLWLPVPEADRGRIREPLESVVTRFVQAASAVVLLVLGILGVASSQVVGAIVVGLTAIWIAAAVTLRNRYLMQLRSNIGALAVRADLELDPRSAEVVVDALASDDERQVMSALQILRHRRRERLVPALILRHPSYDVLALALELIAVPSRSDWQPLTRRLLESRDPRVRMLAIHALAQIGEETAIMAGLCDDDPSVVAHATFWQIQSAPQDRVAGIHQATAQLLARTGADGDAARAHLLSAIREHGDGRWRPTLLALMVEPPGPWIEPLALAMARIPDPAFLPFLLARLDKRIGRTQVGAALVAIGAPALEALGALLADEHLDRRVRLHVPSALALFANERAAVILGDRLAGETSGAVRYRILKALALMAARQEIIIDARILRAELARYLRDHRRLAMVARPLLATDDASESARLLTGILGDKIAQSLDRVFLALQALHPREGMRTLQRALQSTNAHERAHGIELLDTLMRSELYDNPDGIAVRADLAIVIDPQLAPIATDDQIADVTSALTLLLDEPDELLAACAAYHALQLDAPELRAVLANATAQRDVFRPLGLVPKTFHAA